MDKIKQIKRIVDNYRDEKCPECNHEYQTGSQTELNMPYCGECGKIVLDATQIYCCWCGCEFNKTVKENET